MPTDNVESWEVEERLALLMNQEFDTIIEDGSLTEVPLLFTPRIAPLLTTPINRHAHLTDLSQDLRTLPSVLPGRIKPGGGIHCMLSACTEGKHPIY